MLTSLRRFTGSSFRRGGGNKSAASAMPFVDVGAKAPGIHTAVVVVVSGVLQGFNGRK